MNSLKVVQYRYYDGLPVDAIQYLMRLFQIPLTFLIIFNLLFELIQIVLRALSVSNNNGIEGSPSINITNISRTSHAPFNRIIHGVRKVQ